jgi:hypothetical protein
MTTSIDRPLAGVLLALEAAAFVLLPKCPLCIAAALSLWGVSAGAAWVLAPYVPAVSLLVLPLLAASWIWRRRRVRRARERH